jgi:hypothetical protein
MLLHTITSMLVYFQQADYHGTRRFSSDLWLDGDEFLRCGSRILRIEICRELRILVIRRLSRQGDAILLNSAAIASVSFAIEKKRTIVSASARAIYDYNRPSAMDRHGKGCR